MLSERLREARTLAGVKSRELDRLAGLSECHTQHIETGRRPNPETATIAPLARVLGVSLDWLIAGNGPAPEEAAVKAAVEQARQAAKATPAVAPREYPAVQEWPRTPAGRSR